MSLIEYCDISGKKFKSGFMSTIYENREERPAFVVTEDNVTIVKKLVLQNQHISVKQLSDKT